MRILNIPISLEKRLLALLVDITQTFKMSYIQAHSAQKVSKPISVYNELMGIAQKKNKNNYKSFNSGEEFEEYWNKR